MAHILVTGAAGFIGAHTAAALHRAGHQVVGCDSFNSYYPVALKQARVAQLLTPLGIAVRPLDLSDAAATDAWFAEQRFDVVLHLAAQAGVRYSIQAPLDYVQSNLVGFGSVLEAARRHGVQHLLYASSSSVYGSRGEADVDSGFHEDDRTDRPASFYAATKKANEAMAYATAAVHRLPVTGLRFFTVYGPWGRPDMAYWTFSEKIRRGEPLQLFGEGLLLRDFTYVDDVADALVRLIARGPQAPAAGEAPAEVFNVGHHQPVRVLEFVRTLEAALGETAQLEFAPMQPGDVPNTCADSSRLVAAIGPEPWHATPLATGLGNFARWWKDWVARGAA
ncbi:MAG TPA: NAD-dependent epimerase/dehydratase family protein [Burkholderiaceae bacterium]|nr:NAD-dependent epimerase/dehydratase family protein [Burkholderiaceae bacterium]HMY98961.1 NAD-dependent epimerase/dehydratase family protein [Burkholderiaceae bacterium]HNB46409.1 NAD-dependent epimerase/dehydratase family protein [Burkholderiaceae bacterium]HNG81093.1 NAD-dependent epimerase/dehydratase family protein [Burkholderiaceae bacterium]